MEFEKAKQILNKNRPKKLTDSQIREAMKLANLLASCTITNLKTECQHEECDTIREGFHRRAGWKRIFPERPGAEAA
jgi:alcohol dehydrogenase class IV